MTASRFEGDWLDVRARHDGAARDRGLEQRFAAALGADAALVDLACGRGANLLHLAPRLGGTRRWHLVDHDPAHLASLPRALDGWARAQGGRVRDSEDATIVSGPGFEAHVTTALHDLATDLARVVAGADAVVVSAFLDLAGASWLDELAALVSSGGAPLLATLTVDGRVAFTPEEEDDHEVIAAFRLHQQREKGLGRALGPEAARHLATTLAREGMEVLSASSDWLLGAEDVAVQRVYVEGLARAAEAVAPGRAAAWCARRLAHVENLRSTIRVGHTDLLALPRARPPRPA